MNQDKTSAPSAPSARVVAYGVTWLSYAINYFDRKGLSVAKASLEDALGAGAIKGVDTAYLSAYALGQYVNGWYGDRVGARRLVGYGMLLSALACFAFGSSSTGIALLVAMFVNGLALSSGWPGNVKAMAEWTPLERRGAVMGLWSTCYQVGGVAANGVAGLFLVAYGWRWAFHGPALIVAAMGVVVLLVLRPGPLSGASRSSGAPSPAGSELRRRLLRSPLIWSYGICYFWLKLIRYTLLLWLPYYLEKVLHYERGAAAWASTSFEIGGVLGAIVIGYLSDRVRSVPRSAVAVVSLLALAASFRLYSVVGGMGVWPNFFSMALIGFMLFGPDTLISGAAAQDAGGPQAAALAAGLINGIGSLGAVAQEVVARTLTARWGWDGLFQAFLVLSLVSAVCLLPTLRRRPGSSEPPA